MGEFVAIADEAEKNLRDILDVPAEYKVIFVQGGATLQFAAIPLNMLGAKSGSPNFSCNTKATKFTTIPSPTEWTLDPEAAYVHYCANETVNGVEFHYTPDVGETPLVGDMSSNFMSKPIDVRKHACIYAGLQKNAGPSGMAVNIIRGDFASGAAESKLCPTYLSWKTSADNASMYNTPACYTIYAMGEYLKYTKKVGGVQYWAEMSDKKSGLLYDTIGGGDEALEKKFLVEAQKVKLFTLAGHRSVGGCRASLYNGMPLEGVEALSSFMKSFLDENRK